MRLVYGTANSTASSTATQLFATDSNARAFAITVKARKSNGGNAYWGTDTLVNSTHGFELTPGDNFPINLAEVTGEGTALAANAYISAASTTDLVDWVMLIEI